MIKKKCVKCGSEFQMPDNFIGSILCENCDSLMEDKEINYEKLCRLDLQIRTAAIELVRLNRISMSDYEEIIKIIEKRNDGKEWDTVDIVDCPASLCYSFVTYSFGCCRISINWNESDFWFLVKNTADAR